MSSRYLNKTLYINNSEYYMPLKAKRGVKIINHYGTTRLRHPPVSVRANLSTEVYIWKYGDRFYQLAERYYSDVRYWWVIAWYNGLPTEADVYPGDVLHIPIDIQSALKALRIL